MIPRNMLFQDLHLVDQTDLSNYLPDTDFLLRIEGKLIRRSVELETEIIWGRKIIKKQKGISYSFREN
jgi:hypothetical protein